MILEHNPYIKSPEELDIDFKEELSTKPDTSENFKNEVRFAPDKNQNILQNGRVLTDEDENTGTGLILRRKY
jgi:hypothetical protein